MKCSVEILLYGNYEQQSPFVKKLLERSGKDVPQQLADVVERAFKVIVTGGLVNERLWVRVPSVASQEGIYPPSALSMAGLFYSYFAIFVCVCLSVCPPYCACTKSRCCEGHLNDGGN